MGTLTDRFKAKLGKRPRANPATQKHGTDSPASVTPHSASNTETEVAVQTVRSSIPERLWNNAYDQARESDGAVVDAYEKMLSARLHQDTSSGDDTLQSTKLESQSNDVAADPVKRRAQMRQLVSQGLQRTEKDARSKSGAEHNIRTILVVKESVDKAIHASPEAAIPWVGVCIALELLVNPLTEASSNRQGIVYVVSRMDWYWNMATLLLSDNLIDPNAAGLRVELEKVITELYTTLLLFQMKSVCYYHRGRFSVWLRDTIKLDDWGGELGAIQAAEAAVQRDSDQYNTTNIRNQLGELATTAKTNHLKLDSIRSAVQEQTLKQENWHNEAANNKCLRHLLVTNPRYDKKRIEWAKGGLLRDSFVWIFENECFREWRDDPQKRLLRIRGDPGMGKTMLLCGVIDDLQESIGPRDVLSYFFCQETESNINNATAVLRGLVYLLVTQQPHLIQHVRKRYDEAGENLFADANTFVVLSDIFNDLVQDSTIGTCYLAIDALDECVRDQSQLLRLITEHTHQTSRVKWILTSRDVPEIDEGLQRPDDSLKLVLPLSPKNVSTGIGSFIKQRVEGLSQDKRYDQKTYDAVFEYLETNARGTFLWVALVCQDLQKVPRWNAVNRIQEFPPGLKSLYQRMLERMRSSDEPDLCKQVMAVASIVFSPVSIYELIRLAPALDKLTGDLDSVRQVVSLCGSFLTVRDEYIYFVHQSAKDFVLDEALDEVFPEGIKMAHLAAYSRCIESLSRDLQRDMYSLGAPGSLAEDYTMPCPDPIRASYYACVSWVDHLIASGIHLLGDGCTDLRNCASLDLFLRTKYLHWLEALSLGGCMLTAQMSLNDLRLWIQISRPANMTGLQDFIKDAQRFLLSNQVGIGKAPLQVYVAALLFSPKNSLTRQAFTCEEPDWITFMPNVDDQWGACLYTLEGHRSTVWEVTFSHDSYQMATASEDSTVRLWHVKSGAWFHTFEGHSHAVRSVAFSHDSKLLASGSLDKTIRIWTISGEHLRTIEVLSGPVKGVAFSADSSRIASESMDGTINIWKASSGHHVQTLASGGNSPSHWKTIAYSKTSNKLASVANEDAFEIRDDDGTILQRQDTRVRNLRCVAFSHDLTLVALGDYGTIKIRDTAKDVCLSELVGHQGLVLRAAAFSPDSSQLASAATDKTIKIWDVKSGACIRTFIPSQVTLSLAWSHDSTQLVSASGGGTTRLWDAGSNTTESDTHGNSGFIYDIAVSPCQEVLASGSETGTVRLWDTTGVLLASLEAHRGPVRAVAFSHDSKVFASASADSTVKIWDLRQRACLRTFEGHAKVVHIVTFSPNSKLLASISAHDVIRIWNVESGTCVQTWSLARGSDDCFCVCFSPDSTRLISGSSEGMIEIWDLGTGLCIQTIEDSGIWITSAILSNDSTKIASKSRSGDLKIWDATHGTLLAHYHRVVSSELCNFDSQEAVIHTDWGTVSLPQSTDFRGTDGDDSARPRSRGVGIIYEGDWITYNGERVVWLPPEHRSLICRVFGTKVAIPTATGKLRICDLDVDKLETTILSKRDRPISV